VAERVPGKTLALALAVLAAVAIRAQDPGGKMAFDVASVKPGNGDTASPSFPINASDAYKQTGGYLRAEFPVLTYIEFAYKLSPPMTIEHEMLANAPKWVNTDSYAIEAKAAIPNPTKDQMRLMMQSLLAERFKLAVHFETKEVPVFALTAVKPGKLGPKLIAHAGGRPCGDFADPYFTPAAPERVFRGEVTAGPDNFPTFCDHIGLIPKPGGVILMGYRNATMDMIASSLSGAVGQGRPVIDRTGLTGRYDFTLEWRRESAGATTSDDPAPNSVQALRDQLGLKVEATKGSVQVLIIDRIERPSEN
jgi:uncharacterized protein (TIGR03435 family)